MVVARLRYSRVFGTRALAASRAGAEVARWRKSRGGGSRASVEVPRLRESPGGGNIVLSMIGGFNVNKQCNY